MTNLKQRLENLSPVQRQLLKQRLSNSSNSTAKEPIAVVGMACRFPKAYSLDAYWNLIRRGGNATDVIPEDRFPVDNLYDPDYDAEGKMISKWACLLEDLSLFDPRFFGIAPREASRMDPQQRMLLEVAWQAMEHAGIPPANLSKTPTGVFIGASQVDYIKLAGQFDDFLRMIDPHTGTGTSLSIIANRLSYVFNFSGPSQTIDTACSSALVALHQAVQSLRQGECNAALVGAVNVCITPDSMISLSRARMVSPTGQCRPFHEDANGYVRGEGAGVVVLKRLTDAVADGDRLLAVLRHTAVNHGGRTSGITAPNGSAQIDVIRRALAGGGVDPDQISYVEAHGTGTPLGDPIEVDALGQVFRRRDPSQQPVYLTSVKANIGHLEIAAGIAGLIKAILVLNHRQLPAQPGLDRINSRIRTEGSRIKIPTEDVQLPEIEGRQLAGVSSFGFGGTNAHAVIERVPEREPNSAKRPTVTVLPTGIVPANDSSGESPARPPSQQVAESRDDGYQHRRIHLLTLSALSDKSLQQLATSFHDLVEKQKASQLGDICHSAAVDRTHHANRVVIRVTDKQELIEDLERVATGCNSIRVKKGQVQFRGDARVAFLGTGQGSQYSGMGRELYESHPSFRESMDRCDEIIREERQLSLLEVMFDPAREQTLHHTAWTQPALYALEVSLADLWKSWGVRPAITIGHSVGQYAAAYVAGVFSLEDGLRLIARRGELMGRLPVGGGMAVIFAPPEQVTPLLERFEGRVEVAAFNGPTNTTVTGQESAINMFLGLCDQQQIGNQRLTVSHAFHSYLMDPILDEFERYAESMELHAPRLPLVCNLTGQIAGGEVATATYWRNHIRGSVQFAKGISTMVGEDLDAMIEIGPTPSLLSMARRCQVDHSAATIASMRKGNNSLQSVFEAVASYHVAGGTVDWTAFDQPWQFQRVDLPTYPFDQQSYWLESEQPTRERLRDVLGTNVVHPLLGKHVQAAETTLFQRVMRSDDPSSLEDHIVQGQTIVPGSGYTEMGFAAARELLGEGSHRVEDLNFKKVLFLSDTPRRVQMVISSPNGSRYPFRIYSQPISENADAEWELHATGTIVRGASSQRADVEQIDLQAIYAEGLRTRDHQEFYQLMSERNLQYGPSYRILDGITQGFNSAIAKMRFHQDVTEQLATYTIPPAIGDGAMHAAGGVVPLQSDGEFTPYSYLPASIRSVEVFGEIDDELVAVARRTSDDHFESPETVTADVLLTDSQGRCRVRYCGVVLRRLAAGSEQAQRSNPDQWLYQLGWEKASLLNPESTSDTREEAGESSDDSVHDVPTAGQDGGQSEPAAQSAGQVVDRDKALSATLLILADQSGVGEGVARQLAGRAARVIVIHAATACQGQPKVGNLSSNGLANSRIERFDIDPTDSQQFKDLVQELNLEPSAPLSVIHAWSLDIGDLVDLGSQDADRAATAEYDSAAPAIRRSRELSAAATLNLFRALSNIAFTCTPKILIVTCGGQIIESDRKPLRLMQQEMIGIGRVATLEFAGMETRCVDIDPAAALDQSIEQLLDELRFETPETQVAYRDGQRWAGRLQRIKEKTDNTTTPRVPKGTPYRLTIGSDSTVDSLQYKPYQRTRPRGREVEVEIKATGLNFSDVLKSLGMYPGITDEVIPVGIECAGVVTRIGDQVTELNVGDEVMGVVPHGFASHCLTSEQALVRKPGGLDFEEAASIPIAFMTAYHCLVNVARLAPGEKVLIHAGAGGVGLAAIQIAQDIGAEIFATAGSDSKREYLRSIGVEHVFNSRHVEFADQIRDQTENRGVDVVLNSLPGDAIDHSLSLLRDYGRFVEIGKVDIYQNKMIGLIPFQRNLSYTAVDLDHMFRHRPDQSQRLLSDVMMKFDQGDYQPGHLTVFDTDQVDDAFFYMLRRQNIGKIVVTMEEVESESEAESEETLGRVQSGSTYLVTGGLGALGRKIAAWLADQGAESIVLSSRRKPTEQIQAELDEIAEQYPGSKIIPMEADVSDRRSLKKMLERIDRELPPLRGIIHAAGVVEMQFMTEMTMDMYDRVVAAKIEGGWNLHRATRERALDFLVFFSSVSTIIGTIQQSAYGAANAFLDGLAHYRRKLGLPATAINWGPWADVGMAAEHGADLASRGNFPLPAADALNLMGRLMREQRTQATVMMADWSKLLRAYDALRRSGEAPPMFNHFKGNKNDEEQALAEARALHAELMQMSPQQRQDVLQGYLAEQVAHIMGLEPSDLDINQSLNTMGLDSLMAIELANKLQLTLQVSLPMSIFIENPTIKSLAKHSAAAMDGGASAESDGLPQQADGLTESSSAADGQASAHGEENSSAVAASTCAYDTATAAVPS